MGQLRLLYCDSAGVRRCRVLVHDGQIPCASVGAFHSAYAGGVAAVMGYPTPAAAMNTGHPTPPNNVSNQPSMMEVTPSISLAAGAGCITVPTVPTADVVTRVPSMSLGRVSEDRVLSPEATDPLPATTQQEQQPALLQAAQQQAAQQQPAPAAPPPASNNSGTSTPAMLSKLGSFTTAPGLKPSPSMILAAAAGAIAVPMGADIPRYHSNTSLDEFAGGASSYSQLSQPSDPAAAAGGGIGAPARTLEHSPSMMLAAAAGILPAGLGGGASTGVNSAASSRHQSPARLSSATAAAGGGGGGSNNSNLGVGAMLPMSPVLMSKMSPASKPRPLVSAFVKSPLAVGGTSVAAVPSAAALSAAAEYSVTLTKACMGQPAFADQVVGDSGLSPVGEVLLVPDLSAAVPCHAQDTLMAPVDMVEKDLSQPWSCCPRSALKRALSTLEARYGLTVVAGFELEFVLLKPAPLDLFKAFPEAAADANVLLSGGQAWVPLDSSIYCQAGAMTASATMVMQDIVASLQAVGIGVVQYHPEAAPGQFEVALAPFAALQAADKLLLAREVVAGVVSRHGLAVSCLPKVMANQAGNGCHVHFSLWRGTTCIMAESGSGAGAPSSASASSSQLPPGCHAVSPTAGSFLAGVLEHLPALLTFTAPSPNSYERLKPCTWSGAFVCWGYDNREAPLRVCCPRGGSQATNAEFKAFDGTTNPYIGLAALVAAGMQGLEDGARLPEPVQVDPGAAEHTALAANLAKLPNSLTAALDAWQDDKKLQAALQGVLGGDLVKAFVAVRRCEATANTKPEALLLRY